MLLAHTPVGPLLLRSDRTALTEIRFLDPGEETVVKPVPHAAGTGGNRAEDDEADPVLREARRQLLDYLAGRRTDFDLSLKPTGTNFQQRVWAALLEIPYGATVSYGQIAQRLGMPPGASRAVGLANGANPLPIVIPCHRVIGADGSLTGYGGGIDRKRFLLGLESAAAEQGSLFA
ncbi:MAG: methylated-DNA--[protein]-cysteine S-methyltransferase [Nocardioidaceae bacterium]